MNQEYLLEPTNGRPAVRFTGELLATVSSKRKGAKYWTELEAYYTRGGKWIVASIGAVDPDNDEGLTRHVDVFVFEDSDQLTRKIGHGRLSSKLYNKLGFDEVSVD